MKCIFGFIVGLNFMLVGTNSYSGAGGGRVGESIAGNVLVFMCQR